MYSRSKGECSARMVRNVSQQENRLETTRARPGQPAEGVLLVASRGLHAFCAPPHTLLVHVHVPRGDVGVVDGFRILHYYLHVEGDVAGILS